MNKIRGVTPKITRAQLMSKLNIALMTVYRWEEKGLPVMYFGQNQRMRRYDWDEVLAWMEKEKGRAPEEYEVRTRYDQTLDDPSEAEAFYLTRPELASVLQIDLYTIHRWEKRGMPFHILESHQSKHRYLWTEVLDWIEKDNEGYESTLAVNRNKRK